ncbi:MAG: hypothetical protein JXR96_20860 [Deltaproteobacteria bacterium]|nr:hypothetical protein [Deltaproteobacteria bacterium]
MKAKILGRCHRVAWTAALLLLCCEQPGDPRPAVDQPRDDGQPAVDLPSHSERLAVEQPSDGERLAVEQTGDGERPAVELPRDAGRPPVERPEPSEEDRLWRAIADLGSPETREPAKRVLRDAGRKGFDLCLKAARMGEEMVVQDYAGFEMGLIGISTVMTTSMRREAELTGSPGNDVAGPEAAGLAAVILSEHPDWQAELLRSADMFERQLALLSTFGDMERFEQTLDFVMAQPDTMLPRIGQMLHASTCPERIRTKGLALAHRSQRAVDVLDGELKGELVTCLQGGRCGHYFDGYGSDPRLILTQPDGKLALSPRASLDLYAALRAQKTENVKPVLSLRDSLFDMLADLAVGEETRKKIAAALAADLPELEGAERDLLAARLINAGFETAHRPVLRPGEPDQDVVFEAMLRGGAKGAREAVFERVFCRYWPGDTAELGFAASAGAADLAAEIATRCPGDVVAATAALVRLQDARARRFLEPSVRALSIMDGPPTSSNLVAGEALGAALHDRGTAEIGFELECLAKSYPRARSLLAAWKRGRAEEKR